MATRFSEAYTEILTGLASKKFSSDKEWQAFITRARSDQLGAHRGA
jgi:hypothetical protein